MNYRLITWTVILLLCFCGAKAQTAEPSDSLKEVYRSGEARFYKFYYPSKSATGEDVVLSSLLVAWMPKTPAATDSIESLHIYSHYTITADSECPSSDSNTTDRMIFGMLVKKCVLIAPDYEGFGVSKDRNHPYLSERLTAQQVTDAVEYGLLLYRKHVSDERALAFKSDWRSYSYGFSQGGAVALAVHRHIEENGLADELRFSGSICGDGPYDLIATLRYYLLDDGTSYGTTSEHQQGMTTLPMVMPMIIKGMLDTHPAMRGHTIDEYLSQQFLDTGIMQWLASKELSTGDISKRWYKQLKEGLTAGGRHYTPAQMAKLFYSPKSNNVWARLDKLFTPGFYDYIANSDNFEAGGAQAPHRRHASSSDETRAYQDIHQAMIDNSVCHGWEPQHRIQFVHARGDMVVPFGNYLAFRDAHPGDEGVLYRLDDSITTTDHTTAGTQFFIGLAIGIYSDAFQWLDESPATGIEAIPGPTFPMAGNEGAAWYTLDGRRLNERPARKGIYIRGGRKVAIR